ncbi:MAG: hypothetical protein ACRDD1_13770, partial [Planctomycetia bacterium]
MSKPTDAAVVEVRFWIEPLPSRAPLKFGGRIVAAGETLNVELRVKTRAGRQAVGLGSMTLGNVWAWPSAAVDPETSGRVVKNLAERIARAAKGLTEFAHPLDHA